MKFEEALQLFLLPVYQPIKRLQQLLVYPQRLLLSSLIFLFLGLLYTLSVQLAYSRGITPGVTPFINIPVEDYYYWQRFWQIPFFFITTIVFSGIVRLLSEMVSGKGSFENIFCILAVAQSLPMFVAMWVPETINFLFFPDHNIYPVWLNVSRQIMGILWPLMITVVGVVISEKIKWYYSALFVLIASIPMTALMIIFIR